MKCVLEAQKVNKRNWKWILGVILTISIIFAISYITMAEKVMSSMTRTMPTDFAYVIEGEEFTSLVGVKIVRATDGK